ncbi:MAG: nucleotide pyrophosphatase/phosphodiesterase family protein [Rhodoglobus sp.]
MSLADVLPSCLAALRAEPNSAALPRANKTIVLLVDGLGAASLRARAGHARTLSGFMSAKSVIDSGFPTTTASALATLATGTLPGQHGMVGYTVLDGANDRVVNQLSGWDERIDPLTWQRERTVFERAADAGIASVAIGPARYSGSGFSAAVLRGATYLAGASIGDRLELAATVDAALVYVYVPELDMAAHTFGWESGEWTRALETLDAAITRVALGPSDGMLVTADHGIVDVPQHGHILIDTAPQLVDGVRFVAGDPRCLQLHFEPDLSIAGRERLIAAWRDSESDRSWVATREQAIAADWFGPVRDEVEPRIGDLLVAARKNIAYYDSRTATAHGLAMVGQHGSWSPAEVQVPLLRLGVFE